MISQREAKGRAEELAKALAPTVGVAHMCRTGEIAKLERASALEALAHSILYFRKANKVELAASIECMIASVENGGDVARSGAEVLLCAGRAYPTGGRPLDGIVPLNGTSISNKRRPSK